MKKLIRKFLNYFGYDFQKVMRTPLLKKKEYPVQVGKFQIIMPAINPLIITYHEQKDFASEIGRLVTYVYDKYPGLIFLDVGANTGDTAAIVKSVKDIPVISIEGDEFSFSYLQKNTQQFKNVAVINQFLGERDEELNVSLEKKGWNTTIVPAADSKDKIRTKTLDSVLASGSFDIEKIKILKIDTEGYDTIILRGAKELIRKAKPVIYFEYNRDNMSAIREDGLSAIFGMEKAGYKKILFYDDRGRFILSSNLSDRSIIEDMHNYADGKKGFIYYYNICLFHEEDTDIALQAIKNENLLR